MLRKSKVNVFLLLDRSGSMVTNWAETIGSINLYVEKLKSATVTLATFDSGGSGKMEFEVIRDEVKCKDWKKVTTKEAEPRGGTPLYDAVGRIVSMAKEADGNKTVIAVMTDGQENASKEYTRIAATAAITSCKDKGWEVVFLGADFDAFGQAASVGVMANKTLNMTRGNYGAGGQSLAMHTNSYATMDCCEINFNEDDRAKARGDV